MEKHHSKSQATGYKTHKAQYVDNFLWKMEIETFEGHVMIFDGINWIPYQFPTGNNNQQKGQICHDLLITLPVALSK